MACGCVPIVSNVGESKVIADFGQDSYDFLFPPKEDKGAVKCLESLYALHLLGKLEPLKTQGRAHIVEKFSVDSMVNKTLKILTSLTQSISVEILKVELQNSNKSES